MSAYVIVDVDVQDTEGYARYRDMAPESIAQYGGRYLARGGKTEVLEGEWQPKRLVILQFDSLERAKEWLNSSEYSPARKLRHQYAKSNMVVIEGTPNL
ncbi:MAG: DUF1330 domain-containing protein [Chloroflexi bacterium]|nr:DUF1330 domain-containing protein [Chloroflexota bacterium]